jgi:hypothetical protein
MNSCSRQPPTRTRRPGRPERLHPPGSGQGHPLRPARPSRPANLNTIIDTTYTKLLYRLKDVIRKGGTVATRRPRHLQGQLAAPSGRSVGFTPEPRLQGRDQALGKPLTDAQGQGDRLYMPDRLHAPHLHLRRRHPGRTLGAQDRQWAASSRSSCGWPTSMRRRSRKAPGASAPGPICAPCCMSTSPSRWTSRAGQVRAPHRRGPAHPGLRQPGAQAGPGGLCGPLAVPEHPAGLFFAAQDIARAKRPVSGRSRASIKPPGYTDEPPAYDEWPIVRGTRSETPWPTASAARSTATAPASNCWKRGSAARPRRTR